VHLVDAAPHDRVRGAPPTPADSETDRFVADMHYHGFHCTNGDQDLINTGKLMCTKLYQRESPRNMRDNLQQAMGWDELNATYFVARSGAAFCPWNTDELTWPLTGLQN
jgi:hypothetical protein